MAEYRIKEICEQRGVTLRELAYEAGLAETRLRRLANNKLENVTVRTLEAIAAYLGVPLVDVFTRDTINQVPEMVQGKRVRYTNK